MAPITKDYISRAKDIETHNHLKKISRIQLAMESLINDINKEKRQHDLRMQDLHKLECLLNHSAEENDSSQSRSRHSTGPIKHKGKRVASFSPMDLPIPQKKKRPKSHSSAKKEPLQTT